MKVLQLLILICSTAFSLTYQENVINVEGSAKRDVLPNKAEFELTVSSVHEIRDSAVAQLNPQIEKLNAIFKKYKLASEEAKLHGFSIRPKIDYKTHEPKLVGYEASKSYDITLHDLSIISGIVNELYTEAGAFMKDIAFARTDRDSIVKVLLGEAVVDARENADILARQSDVVILSTAIISNEKPKHFSYENRVLVNMTDFGPGRSIKAPTGASGAGIGDQLFQIEPPVISLENRVWVTYKIRAK